MAPTASGKTALAYQLYDSGRFEIVSVDSALIYRDMTIGTAKPTPQELARYPHHLVDIIDPTESYSVANFVADVEALVEQIHARGKIPLLVGGTMMYYMALFTGMSPVPDTDQQIRDEVEAWRQAEGIEALHEYLKQFDPVIAERLNATDTQRVTRAVEVYKQTGKPLSEWQKLPKQALADNTEQYWLGLAVMPDRPWLHERIALRLQMMWDDGLVEEVLQLVNDYQLSPDTPAMRCVGYRQVVDYLLAVDHLQLKKGILSVNPEVSNGGLSTDIDSDAACQDMKNKALYATRQLAKRQYTWLRNLVATHGPDESNQAANNKVVCSFSSMDEVKQYLFASANQ
ncbi:tRNA (adenosine(37)-N6)-dimethylallyltransferase MiaA [Psychrobacter sp. FDAARGOS_221]|uniref:tRNA (adenosine(37)-N6)-dimethylallyltransferase MiaA n=1 Tax=Psychrobacter sp. FDAARGOS_221 TaxID=1975705 RepID=UPI001D0D7FEF|nr:tRNA (adenosine(37)-N6)-dimethylallyltransferase MiaA [Psychrobacter sp. FDAARGOS_221]